MNQKEFYSMLKDKKKIMLNEQQQAAIDCLGSACVLAVPGAGKTTVIVSKIANLILVHGVAPESILTLTFSRASAKDMKDRFLKLFGGVIDKEVHFSTIHSFSYKILRYYHSVRGLKMPEIIESDEESLPSKAKILKEIYRNVNNMPLTDDLYENIMQGFTLIKNKLYDIDNDFDENDTPIKNFKKIYKAYEEFKQENNYIDYNDMLTKAISILKENPDILAAFRKKYKYVLVDEAQDTSVASNLLIKMIVLPDGTVFFAGDDDQCLYGFNGCSPQNMFEYEKNYPEIKILFMEQNFRSTAKILTVANDFIKKNSQRFKKNITTNKESGKAINLVTLSNEKAQNEYLVNELRKVSNLKDCAILFRNNLSAIPIADMLEKNGIPFYIRDVKAHFFNHWVTQDIVSFMKFAMDTRDFDSFQKIYYKMNIYITKSMLEFVKSRTSKGDNREIFDILLDCPFITPQQIGRFGYLKWMLPLLQNKSAKEALQFIESEFKYDNYLWRSADDLGYTPEHLNSIFASNKVITEGIESISDYIKRLEQLQEIMDKAKNNRQRNAVTLSTLHSSKGLEFQNVYIIDMVDGSFPSKFAIEEYAKGNTTPMEEERRLCYVGITRAKESASLITTERKSYTLVPPSRFFIELRQSINRTQNTAADK